MEDGAKLKQLLYALACMNNVEQQRERMLRRLREQVMELAAQEIHLRARIRELEKRDA